MVRLYRSQLFDLVATPWFMVQVLLRATAGDLPSSRTDALQKLVEDAVAELPAEKGLRSHAGATLCELAWEMQRKQLTALPIETVFTTMAEVRGNRGYNLETFYTGLLEHDLLQATGEDAGVPSADGTPSVTNSRRGDRIRPGPGYVVRSSRT